MLRDESTCDGGSIVEKLESFVQGVVDALKGWRLLILNYINKQAVIWFFPKHFQNWFCIFFQEYISSFTVYNYALHVIRMVLHVLVKTSLGLKYENCQILEQST